MVIPCYLLLGIPLVFRPRFLSAFSLLVQRRFLALTFFFERLVAFLSSRLSTSFRALWNQALTTIKFCNPFVLIFIQIAGGVHPPGSVRVATAQSVADAQNEN